MAPNYGLCSGKTNKTGEVPLPDATPSECSGTCDFHWVLGALVLGGGRKTGEKTNELIKRLGECGRAELTDRSRSSFYSTGLGIV